MTVVNPLQRATVAGADTTADHATTYAHQRKVRGAGEACRRQGITLMPVVVESLGGWGEGAVRVRAAERWERVPSQFEILAAILADDLRTFVAK